MALLDPLTAVFTLVVKMLELCIAKMQRDAEREKNLPAHDRWKILSEIKSIEDEIYNLESNPVGGRRDAARIERLYQQLERLWGVHATLFPADPRPVTRAVPAD